MSFERYRAKDQNIQPQSESVLSYDEPVKIVDTSGLLKKAEEDKFKPLDDLWTGDRGPAAVSVDVMFPRATQIYGIPEHADSLALRDTWDSEPYRLYNLDVFEYELNERMALYGSVPFMMSKQAGFYWINTSETYIDIQTKDEGKYTHWMSETGNFVLAIYLAESPMDVNKKFTRSTGLPPMP
jgi:alpha 1,3-glucosidase